ncbi:MAG TPA: T9SS type A sorting domain-containing protein, partial [bacterium]
PAVITFSGFTAGPAGILIGSQLTWNLGTLAPGVYTYSFNVTVANNASNGTSLSNSASLTYFSAPSSIAANSNSVTVVVLTPTFTATPSPTTTLSPTFTPTPVSKIIISYPYPNPSQGGDIFINIEAPGEVRVKWSVFTTAFRQIVSGSQNINGTGKIQWNLTDKTGAKVADGIYYIRVSVSGQQNLVKIFKVLVLR